MLYGITPVQQALLHRRRELRRLYVKEGRGSERVAAVVDLAARASVPVVSADPTELERRADTPMHQGVVLDCGALPTLDLRAFLASRGSSSTVVLALDQIEDPQNLGGLARTAAFLGADALLMHRSRSAPLSAAASKASAGALEYFPVVEVSNLAQALSSLRDAWYRVLGSALDADARDYRTVDVADRLVLVMGNEGKGLRRLTRDKCDELVLIPGRSSTESLNVTVAAGVLLGRFGRPEGSGS